MELGAVLPHNEIGTDPGAIRAYLQGLEEIGATHLLAYDHVLGADRALHPSFSGPYDKEVAFHEPLIFFSFAAAITQHLGFATTVLILPQRQVALVAKQAAEVAILSDNRLRLGVGTGWNAIEYEALNVPFSDRGKRQVEQVEIMRRLWSEDSISYAGTSYTINAAGVLPRPTKLFPFGLGARPRQSFNGAPRLATVGCPWVGQERRRKLLSRRSGRTDRPPARRWKILESRPRHSTRAERPRRGPGTPTSDVN